MTFTFQSFKNTAHRRLLEAHSLLEIQQRYFDGAVYLSLVSAECVLKTLILFSHGTNSQKNLEQKKAPGFSKEK